MKILVAHNHYLHRGGEDGVVNAEIKMLERFGHKVVFFEHSNEDIENRSFFKKFRFLTRELYWSNKSYKEVKEIIRKQKPQIAHIHNIFVMISPSIYYALYEERVPIVQSLHNYRLFCPIGLLYRDGRICEECSMGSFKPAIVNKCWRDSFFLTYTLARALDRHIRKKTFENKISAYIVSSEFSRDKYIGAGLPREKIFVKPNFLDLKIEPNGEYEYDKYALFLGRLIDHKGIYTLLSAFEKLKDYPLKIIGTGPLFEEVKKRASASNNIEVLGWLPDKAVVEYLKKASFLIFPSECYENMPLVLIESLACGVPVIASKIGAIKELIEDGVTGLLFRVGESNDLFEKIVYLNGNRNLLKQMRENALRVYRERYGEERNYELLMEIYKKAFSDINCS